MTKEQWQAIKNHDPLFDGKLYFTVIGAKTFCRTTCETKTCTPFNTVMFNSVEEALGAGYRPCKRCRPDLPEWRGAGQELADRAAEYIKSHYHEKFSLEELAGALFVDRIYLSKCFKAATGTTLLAFHNRCRCDEAAALLRDTHLSMEIIGDRAGFATASHFARTFKSIYGCSPTEYRFNYLSSLD